MKKGSVRALLRARVENDQFDLASVSASPPKKTSKADALRALERDSVRLGELDDRLYAEHTRSLLLVLQGMDTSGKDGTVKHVIGSVNPQSCRITSFKAPTREELSHEFLWRIRRALPKPGELAVFNRSHYEDVVIVRVHDLVPERTWRARYAKINAFEAKLAAAGTTIVKVFLHITREEQRKRLLARLDDPRKRWKFNEQDLAERALWNSYQAAYAEAIARCSTDAAPWYVVPADSKWYRNWAVSRLLIETLEEMHPTFPRPQLDLRKLKKELGH